MLLVGLGMVFTLEKRDWVNMDSLRMSVRISSISSRGASRRRRQKRELRKRLEHDIPKTP